MKKISFLFLLLPFLSPAQNFSKTDITRYEQRAKNVQIIRDKWGIPHVYGKTDADAVFGIIYAQCEDDFKRVEFNYIEKLGRMSEVEGEKEIWEDLYIRMVIDSSEAISDYQKSPAWLKSLLNAWADGINFYLYKNPSIKPALIKRFKPWYPLLWTDGSIGAINTGGTTPEDLQSFYTGEKITAFVNRKQEEKEVAGSNGFAIAPAITASGHSILYINPHVTFYFRPEVQMVSQEGLNAYGAVTWGQFFIYQGFNQYCGWMHTSGNTDVADMYAEKVNKKNNRFYYTFENQERLVNQKEIIIRFLKDGSIREKNFTMYSTHHGPVMAKRNGQWISVKSYNRSLKSLEQSWLRTKAKGLEEYKKVMYMKANTSNNTVFADNKGNIAYWHGNYIPIRDTAFNWSDPVDGSIKATEWKGLHMVDESVHIYNPSNGWIQNCNSTPFTAAGIASPAKSKYPPYMAPDGENFRGINAARVLAKEKNYTIEKVIAAGYDTYLPAFEILVPALIRSFDKNVPVGNELYKQISEAVSILRNWDYRAGEKSVATALAIEWAQKLNPAVQRVYIDQGQVDQVSATRFFAENAGPDDLLLSFRWVVNDLTERFGTWNMPWGEINRYQRLTGNIKETYDDAKPSLPVGFASATWGCLPSYVSRQMPGTKKRYGTNGNSFICVVEFGPRIKAKSLLAGGVNSMPASPHFGDQAEMYTQGKFKEVLFYKEDVLKNAERSYIPGKF
jgi:acyl-homoserine-lactone acylase